ncbi:glycosyltransferase [Phaeovulum sp.]|uniref:glycosyltransferase n=1 Tax=Phaeovulum sp. TaxID=2934796 RepID=UPI0039E4BEA3
MIKLQTIIFPGTELPATEDMYFHAQDKGVISSISKGVIYVPAWASVRGDTYFNGFSVGKWKEICQVDDLSIAFTGQGRALVRIGVNVLDHASRWLHESEITLSKEPSVIPINAFSTLVDGILFFQIIALEDLTLSGGYYFTHTAPPNKVKLGIVVTHFNRKHYVLPAIRRVTAQLLGDPEMEGRISMVVVDNSQNITPEEASCATVIPNQNLGGAGGFTRGLLHLKDNGFSHCLFMDDDASCEIESIRRTFRILQYAKSPKLAIAGSMMREAAPYEIHEAGAVFQDGRTRPLKNGFDLRCPDKLLSVETKQEHIDYGGWWHFAFRIDQVQHLAFPFFVRGDDILFALSNDFDIFTMNGIGEWAEDFEIKENPFTRYLTLRSTLVLALLKSSRSKRRFLRMYRRLVRDCLYSYNYSSARAFTVAMQHVMRGPEFWRKNIDMIAVREELGRLCPGENMASITMPVDLVMRPSQESRWHRFARRITLNGFLLPKRMIRDKTVLDRKDFIGDARKIYRFRRVLYTAPNGNAGYLAKYDKYRFWEEFNLARQTAREFRRRFPELKRQYAKASTDLMSEAFWRGVYNECSKPSPHTH